MARRVLTTVAESAGRQKTIYFIGIGGTAMAGAAVMARQLGFRVRGADANIYPPTLNELVSAEIDFSQPYNAENLAYGPDLVVVGNAISRGNTELEAALSARLELLSLPEFLARFVIHNRRSLVVAGTHGKTTTTSLVAHILRSCGIDAGYMIGGVAPDFLRSADLGSADAFVIEGDEYDTSVFDPRPKFLSYRPSHVLINNIEFDHADIFADFAAVETAFARLVKIIPDNGLLVTNADNATCMKLARVARPKVLTFGRADGADYRLLGVNAENNTVRFAHAGSSYDVQFSLAGAHNALNMLAAIALVTPFNLEWAQIAAALSSFKGVKRRLEVRVDNKKVTVIEDFAHHPTAIRTNIETLRARYPRRRLLLLIEPRSNTMVRNIFQRELAEAIALADEALIAEIYRPEKYAPAERLDLVKLIAEIRAAGKKAEQLPPASRLNFLRERLQIGDVVCFMTNGSFGGLIDETAAALTSAP